MKSNRSLITHLLILAVMLTEIRAIITPINIYAGDNDTETVEWLVDVVSDDTPEQEDDDRICEETEMLTAASETDFTWSGNIITGYTGTDVNIVIPGKATAIGQGAFTKNEKIKSLSFEQGSLCKKIDTGAFSGCSYLKSVVLPDALEVIGTGAFKACSINEIIIPENVDEICNDAFTDNASLKKVTINAKEITKNADSCFMGCNIEEVIFADGMKSIPQGLFSKAGFAEGIHIDIPDSVEKISTGAFADIDASYTVKLPACLEEIGDRAFSESGLTGELVFPVSLRKIGTDAFYGCIYLSKTVYDGSERQWKRLVKVESGNQILFPMEYLIVLDFSSDIWSFGNSLAHTMKDFEIDFLKWFRFKVGIKDDIPFTSYMKITGSKYSYEHEGHNGLCHGMSVGIIANYNGWRSVSDNLHDMDRSEVFSDICLMQLLQKTDAYTKAEKEFSKKSDYDKVQELIDAAENANDWGPSLLSLGFGGAYGRDHGHTLVIVGIASGNYIMHEINGDEHPYDLRIRLYDSNWRDASDYGPELYKGDQNNGKKCDIYVDSQTHDWGIYYESSIFDPAAPERDPIIVSYDEDHKPTVSSDEYDQYKGCIKLVTHDSDIIFYDNYGKRKWWLNEFDSPSNDEDETDISVITTYGGDVLNLKCGSEEAVFERGNIISESNGIYCSAENGGNPDNPGFMNAFFDENVSDTIDVVTESGGKTDFSIKDNDCFYGIEIDKTESVSFDKAGSANIRGAEGDFYLTAAFDSLPADCWSICTISGNYAGDLELIPDKTEGIIIKGDDLDGLVATLEDGDGNTKIITLEDSDKDGQIKLEEPDEPGREENTHSALDPRPFMDDQTSILYLVNGQKFNLGEGWSLDDSDKADYKEYKKLISIDKKGNVKAKKTGSAVIVKKDVSGNVVRSVSVNISKPELTNKKLTLVVGEEGKDRGSALLKCNDNIDVYYYSSAPDVALVDRDGNVTAVAKGTAKITAYANGKAYICSVTVKEQKAAVRRTLHINTGKSKSVNVKGLKKTSWEYADGTPEDQKKAVSIKGSKIKGETAGTVTLIARSDTAVYELTVIINDPALVAVKEDKYELIAAKGKNKYIINIEAGQKLRLEYLNMDQPVIYKTTKPDIAFIDENGTIEARNKGKAKLTTKINGERISISVNVR